MMKVVHYLLGSVYVGASDPMSAAVHVLCLSECVSKCGLQMTDRCLSRPAFQTYGILKNLNTETRVYRTKWYRYVYIETTGPIALLVESLSPRISSTQPQILGVSNFCVLGHPDHDP